MKPSLSLLALLNEVDLATVKSPTDPVAPGETKVGVLSEHCRRLWGLFNKACDQCASYHPKIDAIVLEQEKLVKSGAGLGVVAQKLVDLTKLQEEMQPHMDTRELLHEIFWNTVKLEFPGINDKSIGLRDGFVVVTKKEERRAVRVISLSSIGGLELEELFR